VGHEEQAGVVVGFGGRGAGGAGFEFVDDGEAVVGALLLEDFEEGGGAGVAEAGLGTPVRVTTVGEPLLSWRMTRLLELLMPGPEIVAWKTAVEEERLWIGLRKEVNLVPEGRPNPKELPAKRVRSVVVPR
jgi:hypothetical protein